MTREIEPGQKGSEHLLAQYGDRLIGVRYRYDSRSKKRLKTERARRVGGKWNPNRKVWESRYDQAVELQLDRLIVHGDGIPM